MNDEIKLLRDYISDLEKGLDSSIKLNKAQVERQVKKLTDEEIWALAHIYLENNDVLGFARAVLGEAQIRNEH